MIVPAPASAPSVRAENIPQAFRAKVRDNKRAVSVTNTVPTRSLDSLDAPTRPKPAAPKRSGSFKTWMQRVGAAAGAALVGATALWAAGDLRGVPFGVGKLFDSLDGEESIVLVSETSTVEAIASVVGYSDISGHDFQDVDGFVDQELAAANGKPIESLFLAGHGSSGRQIIGGYGKSAGVFPQWIQLTGGSSEDVALARLRGHFTKDAVVTLAGCNVAEGAQGKRMLQHLADLLQVRVQASEEVQNALHGLEGNRVIECSPSPTGAECKQIENPYAFR